MTVRIVADGSGNVAESYRHAVYRVADADAVSYAQLDRAVQRIDDLEGPTKTRAERLVRETDGDGLRLVDELDGDSLQRVLDLDIDRAHEFWSAAARKHGQGLADADDVDAFARHADNLQGVDGLNSGPVKDFITAGRSGDVAGAVREVQVADRIGAGNIDRMGVKVGPSGMHGELDIKLKNGEVVEVKQTFGSNPMDTFDELEKKLTAMKMHESSDLDGNTLTIRAETVKNVDDVQEKVIYWQQTVRESSEWNNADIDIRVYDGSTGTIVAE